MKRHQQQGPVTRHAARGGSVRRGRALALALLTLLVAVHPLAGSGRACGLSLARLAKELLCGCEHCGAPDASTAPAAEAPTSCCAQRGPAHNVPEVVSAADAGGCAERCPCTHPGDLPVPHDAPLGTPRDGGGCGSDALRRALDAGAAQASFVRLAPGLHAFAECDPAAVAPAREPPRGASTAARRGTLGARPRLERGAIAYLALLCTARI